MQCPTCDANYDNGDAFCRRCGSSLPDSLQTASGTSNTALLPENERDLLPVLFTEPVKQNLIRGAAILAVSVGLEVLCREVGRRLLQPASTAPWQIYSKKARLDKGLTYTVIESVMVRTRRIIISK